MNNEAMLTDEPFHCIHCDMGCVKNDHLKEHLMIPTGDNSYQCSECDKVFSNNSILTSHLMIHTKENPY